MERRSGVPDPGRGFGGQRPPTFLNSPKRILPSRRKACACLAICIALVWGAGARADPALWVARSASTIVYLFGTIHVLPQGQAGSWMDAAISKALQASTELWTEADIGDLSSSVAAIRRYGLSQGPGAAALLPTPYRRRFARQVAQGGLPAFLVDHARPWLAEILLNAAAVQRSGPVGLGAESSLLAYANHHHLRLLTFETLDQQFAMMANMPQAAQLASLEEQVDEFDQAGPMFRKLLTAWLAGDVDALDRLTNQDMRAHDAADWAELIQHRNERFAQKLGARLRGGGTAFVAVGAAHLLGPSGVPALLTQAGFVVTRVQ